MKIESGAVVATFLMSLYSFWVAFLIEKKKVRPGVTMAIYPMN